jgi:hypothetical protein
MSRRRFIYYNERDVIMSAFVLAYVVSTGCMRGLINHELGLFSYGQGYSTIVIIKYLV